MVFGHGGWNDVFNYETTPTGHTISSIRDDYVNCAIQHWLAYERLRDLDYSDNEANDIMREWSDPDCPDDPIYGCTDPEANNYNPEATMIDILHQCRYDGCMDPEANNYDERATDEPADSCTYDPVPVLGCMDETANNYNELATEDDDSCTYDVVGCMDETACNYDETANIDGEDCKYGDECGMFSSFEDWQLAVGAVVLLLLLK